jgi:hypothetical protein
MNETETYNGTAYTVENEMSRDVGYTGSASHGSQSSALGAGGFAPSVVNTVEEWSDAASVQTVAFD